MPAVHAVLPLDAASDPGLPDHAAEQGKPAVASDPELPGHAAEQGELAVASDPALPGRAAEQGGGQGLISECFHHPGAAAASVCQPVRPAGAALNAGYPDAVDFSPAALPVFPVGRVRVRVRALFVLPAAGSADGLPCHAAGNGIAGYAASVAAPPGDTGLLNTAADK